jgi:hypothetical protein
MTLSQSLLAALLAGVFVSSSVMANSNPSYYGPTNNSVQQDATKNEKSVDATVQWPIGMGDILSQPEIVWATMKQAVHQGQSAAWLTWMRPGLNEGGSMYWWLLSDWWAEQGRDAEAYQSAVQAYVWTRLDQAQCMGNSRSATTKAIQQMIHDHPILGRKQPKELFHKSIIAAIDQAQKIIQSGKPGLGMMCLRGDVITAKKQSTMQKSRHAQSMTITTPNSSQAHQILTLQALALKKLKVELGYEKSWNESTINEAWMAINSSPGSATDP